MAHRTLLILRHGKSAYPAGVADHERPLAERGRREAGLAGDWIRGHAPSVDLVLCSTATRTRQTLEHAAIDAPVQYLEELWSSSHLMYLDAVRAHAGDAATVLVVGHEPSVSATSLALARDRTNKAARAIEEKYPTSSVAVLEHAGEWADLETGRSNLVRFHVPR